MSGTGNGAFDVGDLVGRELEGKWYPVTGTKAEVKIRPVKPARRRRMAKECTTTKMKKGRAIEVTDLEKVNRMLVSEVIVDWRNIVMDGKPLDCTDQNKRLLDDNWPEFNDLWNEVVGQETEVGEALEEAELGN